MFVALLATFGADYCMFVGAFFRGMIFHFVAVIAYQNMGKFFLFTLVGGNFGIEHIKTLGENLLSHVAVSDFYFDDMSVFFNFGYFVDFDL